MEISDLALTKARCTKPRLKASASEVCHALVIRSFRRISLMFTSFVKNRLRCVYGQPSWLTTAKACLGPRMRSYCREDSDWDVYTVCEVLLDQLDGVFSQSSGEHWQGCRWWRAARTSGARSGHCVPVEKLDVPQRRLISQGVFAVSVGCQEADRPVLEPRHAGWWFNVGGWYQGGLKAVFEHFRAIFFSFFFFLTIERRSTRV